MIRPVIPAVALLWLTLVMPVCHGGKLLAPSTIPCESISKDASLSAKKAEAFVAIFGFRLRDFDCAQIVSRWWTSSTVIQFRSIATRLDDTTAFTLVKDPQHRLWMIPISRGMLEISGTSRDPHNLAAFNSILRNAGREPKSADDWRELALGYMTLVGHPIFSAPHRLEYTATTTDCKKAECEVVVSEAIDGTTTNAWGLEFQVHSGVVVLNDVSKREDP